MTKTITATTAWHNLTKHRQDIAHIQISSLFQADHNRFKNFSLETAGLILDYSKQKITSTTIELLAKLATAANLEHSIANMFTGKSINTTENRAVLHTALRDTSDTPIYVNGVNVKPQIQNNLKNIEQCANTIRNNRWFGFTGKPIDTIVNIGIGGSDLGPAMATQALTPFTAKHLNYHFVSNIDGSDITETLRSLNPETTLFIIASKTFTTQETLSNANAAKKWLLNHVSDPILIKNHFIAVTTSTEKASQFGIDQLNIFPSWEWVGGRFSLWSAIGLIIAIAIGMDNFKELLAGAYAMDKHFQEAPLTQNMPTLLAMLGIWNINFWQSKTLAIIPYDQYLSLLPAYLQQLEMESNGKHTNLDGNTVNYATAPVIWGATGTNGQHAFHQLLMQGTQTVPIDFIIPANSHNPINDHHRILFANCLAQSQALMTGKTIDITTNELMNQGYNEVQAKFLAKHKEIPGNIPSNTILTKKITPYTLGSLLALYEHKVFTQGIIWQINSFDQWGVELGKNLANTLALDLSKQKTASNVDSSTQGLMTLYYKLNQTP